MIEIKFRRPHFEDESGKFSRFSYWGPMDSGGFKSPTSISNHYSKFDQQYTGREDLHHEDIYEGDIVFMLGRPYMVVEFNTDTCGYILRYSKSQFVRMDVVKDKILVVGNIYQTPKLISL